MTADGSAGPASPHRATTMTLSPTTSTGSSPQVEEFIPGCFSMGGGDVARYLGRTGPRAEQGRHHRWHSTVPVEDCGQPRRRRKRVFDGILKAVAEERYAFFTEFFNRCSARQALQSASRPGVGTSAAVTSLACVPTWHEDFRADLSPRLPFTARSI
jgi:non-heme chloroperoxidase